MKYITPYITPHTSSFLSSKNTGLGNALFQIASTYGIAKEYGININFNNVYLYCNILKDRFNFNHKDTIFRNIYYNYNYNINYTNRISEETHLNKTYDTKLIHKIINNTNNSIIYGYLESHLYFKNIFDFIKQLFKPDDNSLNIINNKYSHILNDTNISPVSIHFRGNEYLNSYLYDYTYYNNAIQYIISNTKNPVFLVFTDDKNSINLSKLNNFDNYYFIESDYDYLDLWIMSLCKHNIISQSTFSWWGAFLNNNENKIVLYNKKYNWEMNSIFQPI